ncbi:MAG: hypothetical protein HC910_07765 [Spirulinaceae cyanobacterium SM2_1_0]|nr:hypothetical protein [Spirulinaceae cyanobacterium SM2_1_0]
MLNLESARSKVLTYVSEDFRISDRGDRIVLIDRKTVEFDDAFVFYYNSQRFLETEDFDFMLMGNKPIGISKETERMSYIRVDIDVRDALREAGIVQ